MSEISSHFDAVKIWWSASRLSGPFTPGKCEGNNDGRVRNGKGEIIVDFNGCEAAADVVAALLNDAEERIKGKNG